MSKIYLILLFLVPNAYALVSSPIQVFGDEQLINVGVNREAGFIKPSTDKDSFNRSAENIITNISYVIPSTSNTLEDLTYKIEYRHIQTPKEKVSEDVIYEANSGHQLTLGFNFSLFHEVDSRLDTYLNISPLIDVNENKFALPRIDLIQLGLVSSFNMNSNTFLQTTLHLGSGIPDAQNPYILISQEYGKRFENYFLSFGPYIEADLGERKDENYAEIYQDEKIKQYKVGGLINFQYRLDSENAFEVKYLQKAFGQYLPSTNALRLSFSTKF